MCANPLVEQREGSVVHPCDSLSDARGCTSLLHARTGVRCPAPCRRQRGSTALGWDGSAVPLASERRVPGPCPGRSGRPEPWWLVVPDSFRQPRTQEILVLPHAVFSVHTHVPY